jgi:hypothetical protein
VLLCLADVFLRPLLCSGLVSDLPGLAKNVDRLPSVGVLEVAGSISSRRTNSSGNRAHIGPNAVGTHIVNGDELVNLV